MDVVAGAIGSLVPKLCDLLKEEYGLQKRAKEQVRSLALELEAAHAALRKVADVPPDQLDEQVRVWAREVREASYDMEDALDAFLVRVEGSNDDDKRKRDQEGLFRRLQELLRKSKARRRIAGAIEDIKKQLDEVSHRRGRYTVGDIAANSASAPSAAIDPRLAALYTDATKLVGIDSAMDELMSMLSSSHKGDDDDASTNQNRKVVSVVGFGGLGKTTLAKAVYDKLKADFSCSAFVPVGRNPDLKKVFQDILIDLDKQYFTKYVNVITILDERQLIDHLQNFLKNKRYFIVIDDIWDVPSWKTIEYALHDRSLGSRIIITTRNGDVAARVGNPYKLKPLTPESSKTLFYKRIFGSEDKCPEQILQVSGKILKKCGGVPLAIITISSLLAIKDNITEWHEVCDSIGSGVENNPDLNDMRKVLSLSYYDLPSHLKSCLLYLSIFPEGYHIRKNRLIRRWIAEDFIQHEKSGDNLFDIGERYFNELINRSMMQPALMNEEGMPEACCIHDLVLDLICSLSREENFVTIPDHIEQSSTHWGSKVHRLSLQKPTTSTCTVMTSIMSQVRSFTIFNPAIKLPPLSCFQVLRVLDLEGCGLRKSGPLKLRHIGDLLHLRYLGLRGTNYAGELPVGKLQFLQTLDIQGTDIEELPSSILKLRQLKCLCVDYNHRTSLRCSWLKELTSLEELTTVRVDRDSAAEFVEALGHLTQLRVLSVNIAIGHGELDESLGRALVESLGNLRMIRRLDITDFTLGADGLMLHGWAPPSQLRRLALPVVQMRSNGRAFSTLPPWLNPVSLPLLSSLHVAARQVRGQDLQVLGTMPALRYLWLGATGWIKERPLEGRFVLDAGAFPCAIECMFLYFVTVPSMFPRGAMPMLRRLQFCIRTWDFSNGGNLDLDDLAMGHLPALEHVVAKVYSDNIYREEEVVRLEEALKQAEDVHPNNLLSVSTVPTIARGRGW